ncbi:MAG: DUF4347 domain-containing protein, partial [Gammaproteobacteria bacterium]|nr:DUF4347 domain-containing protein [Gammaproteobacteria bacterium]
QDMKKKTSLPIAPIFEELEPRLLFSADIAEVIAAEPALHQDLEEEPPARVEEVNVVQEENDNSADSPVSIENDTTETGSDTEEKNTATTTSETDKQDTAEQVGEIQDEGAIKELTFINSNVQDYQQLADDLLLANNPDKIMDVAIIDYESDGFDQVSQILNDRSDLSAIHFISHGSEGEVNLGSSWLNSTTLKENNDSISAWGDALIENGDILFYGCNLAETADGQSLVNNLSELTGADVAASDDPTGHASLGGDWDLEVSSGSIEAEVAVSDIAQADYEAVLATYTVSNTDDAGLGSLRQAIIDANANAGTDNIYFNIPDPLVGGAHTISLQSALPDITGTVTIDGTTDADFSTTPIIVLDGSGAGAGVDGLTLADGSDGST